MLTLRQFRQQDGRKPFDPARNPYHLMSRWTGLMVGEERALGQRIFDILMTPKGSRAGERTYGSNLPYLVDRNRDASWRLSVFHETAQALTTWEEYFKINKTILTDISDGSVALSVYGTSLISSSFVTYGSLILNTGITLNYTEHDTVILQSS